MLPTSDDTLTAHRQNHAERVADTFVAGFVGSSPMNLATAAERERLASHLALAGRTYRRAQRRTRFAGYLTRMAARLSRRATALERLAHAQRATRA
ncbi:MAG: hypothetical protein ACRDUA_17415 [Micromonosporaceae bacterium]